MRRVTLLGSTGSIGQNTVDLILRDPDAFDVVALTGGRNIALLAEQARALRPDIVVTAYDDCADDLRAALSGTGTKVAAGRAALVEAAARSADWTLSAIVGAAGLEPGLAALRHGGTLALANKESLVCAGPLLLRTADENGATILPVDSEHSGVFQALRGEDIASIERVVITASGGAFRDWPLEKLARATPDQAATHPNWDMGQRITIDSATMFNKALELIEAHEFFGITPDRIEAVIHRESLVHAIVGHVDGGYIAHLGPPDMRHAIGYALNWPERAHLPVDRLDFTTLGSLTFEAVDTTRYPAIPMAFAVMNQGGLSGAVFNAAKEAALDAFLARKIGFTDMAGLVGQVSESLSAGSLGNAEITLDSVDAADQLARQTAFEMIDSPEGTRKWTA